MINGNDTANFGSNEALAQEPALRAAELVWTPEQWRALEVRTRNEALASGSESDAWRTVTREARSVLRTYSTSFFIVTRFLPPAKRSQVEAIYAAVRYPDEVVDSFPWDQAAQLKRLDEWRQEYERALGMTSVRQRLAEHIPFPLAAFCQVVQENHIPDNHYRAFLDAMARDVEPRSFKSLDDLVDNYIYGSAIVVGYFLTYVYGAAKPGDFERALAAARHLGIALQLTNFLRDVAEDQQRGRQYIPEDMLQNHGIADLDVRDVNQRQALAAVLSELREITADFYARADSGVDAFAEDSRVAIRACIDVYRQLNGRLGASAESLLARESVPMSTKFRVLPSSKYWRLPLAYLTR